MKGLALFTVCCLSVVLRSDGASIVFPGRTSARNSTASQLVFKETPDCATNSEFGLCEFDEFPYPVDIVKEALANSDRNTVSELTKGDDLLLELRDGFGNSDRLLIEETPVCTATEAIIYPKMAKNAENEWFFVVNTPGATQAIRVEKCVDEGSACKVGIEGTICRQKYIYRKMVAVDGNKKAFTENFKIPSCCVCYIKNEFLSIRFDAKRRPASSSAASAQNAQLTASDQLTANDQLTQDPAVVKSRPARQAPNMPQTDIVAAQTPGLSGSPLDSTAPVDVRPAQGTAEQSIETEETLNPSDTIGGNPVGRFVGDIEVHSQAIFIKKKKSRGPGYNN